LNQLEFHLPLPQLQQLAQELELQFLVAEQMLRSKRLHP
jgi:hypothetical protein